MKRLTDVKGKGIICTDKSLYAYTYLGSHVYVYKDTYNNVYRTTLNIDEDRRRKGENNDKSVK